MGSEQEPFLFAKASSFELDEWPHNRDEIERRQPPFPKWKIWSILVAVQLILLLVYSITAIWVIRTHTTTTLIQDSPLHDLTIKFTKSTFHNLSRSAFAGDPSPEIDASWDKLLEPMNIRVTQAELESENLESVSLTEGGGYLSWIAAFHQLHCINMLRKWNYREYYHATLTPSEEPHMRAHVDHCVEFLRQSALCHPDTSLTTFKWHPAKTRPMFNATESEHTCVDWETLVDSISGRRVTEEEILRLKNPLLPTT